MPVRPYPPLLDTAISYTRTRELALDTLLNLRQSGVPYIENLSLEDVQKTPVTTLRLYIRLYDASCADGNRLPRSRQEVDSFFSAWFHTRELGSLPTSAIFRGRLPRAYGPLALGRRCERSLSAVLRALLFGRGVWVREEVLHALQDVLDVPHTKAVLSVKRECEVRPKEEHLISEIALPSCWSVFSSPAEMLAVNGFCVE